MVQCSQCGRALEDQKSGAMVASISGEIMGDEYTESYFFCGACQVYTVRIWRERFCGEDSIRVTGPVSKPGGDAQVDLIKRCSEPWNKKCRCAAHQEYFGPNLD